MISTCLKNVLRNVQFNFAYMMCYWIDTGSVFKYVSYSCIYFEMTLLMYIILWEAFGNTLYE